MAMRMRGLRWNGVSLLMAGSLPMHKVAKVVNVGQLKYYFTVDTRYVLKKLRMLFLPFTEKVAVCNTYCPSPFSFSFFFYFSASSHVHHHR